MIKITGCKHRNNLTLISIKVATTHHQLNYAKAVMTTVVLFQTLNSDVGRFVCVFFSPSVRPDYYTETRLVRNGGLCRRGARVGYSGFLGLAASIHAVGWLGGDSGR